MDPLTAFNLVSGIIQLIDFSSRVILKGKEVYENGASHEYEALQIMTAYLTSLRKDLQVPSDVQNFRADLTPDEKTITELADKCGDTAFQLTRKLQDLKVEGPHRKLQVVTKTIKAHWRKRELQEMQERLNGYRNALDTQVLINIRSVEPHLGLGLYSSILLIKLIIVANILCRAFIVLSSEINYADYHKGSAWILNLCGKTAHSRGWIRRLRH